MYKECSFLLQPECIQWLKELFYTQETGVGISIKAKYLPRPKWDIGLKIWLSCQ